ncbi:hypothetical protein LTR28_011039 [Elasticomyces elasticus]|nr:hypothetical protein LTR28_011039 [Elasticomyces elasticus]
MVSRGQQHARKRPGDDVLHNDEDERPRSVKRRKTALSSGYPPDFWDTLSKYSDVPTAGNTMGKSSSESLKRSHGSGVRKKSSTSGRTSNTSPYNANFLQKMIDRGVFPDDHEELGDDPPEPKNMDAILQALARPRRSLSPSRFSREEFMRFRRGNTRAKSEAQAAVNVVQYITGANDGQYNPAADVVFNNVAKFDPNITLLKPDGYYGARPAQIDSRVRSDLDKYIIPSTRTDLPAVPNFFREDKGASGKPDVARNQAMHAGATGARGMLKLQNYGNATPVYDGNAYTISSTYNSGTGTLQMYATHPGQLASGSADPQYYMNPIRSWAMLDMPETFRSGAAAYRNARDWTKEQRDSFIANANVVAQRRSAGMGSFSRSNTDVEVASAVAEELSSSQMSPDELGL